jgi:hypothetical protein
LDGRGVAKDLEVPFWARDKSEVGRDRGMDLPCFGPKLKGDFNPPFTCGSDTRRSIIKYFVRDEINKVSAGNNLAEGLVRQRIAMLKEAWKDPSKYRCECKEASMVQAHGSHSLMCCISFEEASINSTEPCTCLDGETESTACCDNNFLPDQLTVLFDEIPADEIVRAIVQKIEPYMQKVVTTPGNEAFTKYNDPAKVARWNWVAQGLGESAVKASGLYSTTDPIMFYNASEAGYPFRRGATIWETCAGLVSQVCVCVCVCVVTSEVVIPACVPGYPFDP